MARGCDADVSHLGDFYDHLNVTALSFDHTVALEESVGEFAQALGLPVG